jgi:hypothetical protein
VPHSLAARAESPRRTQERAAEFAEPMTRAGVVSPTRRMPMHWLPAATAWLGVVGSQAPPAGTIPESKCVGCEQAAILPVHFVSKQFYCHPDGSLADKSCAAAHGSPAACCAACLKVNAEKRMCDAWFMNAQGGCFFKNCPPSAWKSGDCHVDPVAATVRRAASHGTRTPRDTLCAQPSKERCAHAPFISCPLNQSPAVVRTDDM